MTIFKDSPELNRLNEAMKRQAEKAAREPVVELNKDAADAGAMCMARLDFEPISKMPRLDPDEFVLGTDAGAFVIRDQEGGLPDEEQQSEELSFQVSLNGMVLNVLAYHQDGQVYDLELIEHGKDQSPLMPILEMFVKVRRLDKEGKPRLHDARIIHSDVDWPKTVLSVKFEMSDAHIELYELVASAAENVLGGAWTGTGPVDLLSPQVVGHAFNQAR